VSRLAGAALGVAILLGPAMAPAGPAGWSAEFERVGFDDAVLASARWDGRLVVGGKFRSVDGRLANRVAIRDGGEWLPLGDGLDGDVHALVAFGGELIAGGVFDTVNGQAAGNVAAWDGATWRPLGAGTSGPVYDMIVWDGAVILVGQFDRIGDDLSTYCIGRWDGGAYSRFPQYPFYGGTIRCVASVGGSLDVGGIFTLGGGVARWTGTVWQALGSPFGGANHVVRSLHGWNGMLVAGGSFRVAGTTIDDLAVFEGGTWQPLPGSPGNVSALGDFDGKLVVQGTDGNVPRVRTWDGAAWTTWADSLAGAVARFEDDPAGPVALGSFTKFDGRPARRAAAWNGATWSAAHRLGVAPDAPVVALAAWDGTLVAAGPFLHMGQEPLPRLARWNGTGWEAFGEGLNGAVSAVATYGGQLVVGGSFNGSGLTTLVRRVACWDGAAWTNLGPGFADGAVWFLEEIDGRLVAGGSFTDTGGQVAPGVAVWDGATWEPLGEGVGPHYSWYTAGVTDAVSFHGDLVVTGGFSTAGGIAAKNIARWNGAAWSPLGDPNHEVDCAVVHDGDLIAGGRFTILAGQPIARIARWDGSAWHAFGTGADGTVEALAAYGGDLVAAGLFTQIDGVPLAGIGRFDGTTWRPLGSGLSGSPAAHAVVGTRLWVGGNLTRAGDRAVEHLASWTAKPFALDRGEWDAPDSPGLLTIGPTPLRAGPAEVRFALRAAGPVHVAVHDVTGRLVRTLVAGERSAGEHVASWDLRATSGAPAAPGVYFLRLSAPDGNRSRKVVVVR